MLAGKVVMQGFSSLVVTAAGVCAVAWSAQASAQLPPALITPLEVRTCDFVGDKGRADLDRLAADFNGWMLESKAPEYDAYVLFPVVHSAEVDFDLAWVGSWPDGATMGESMAHYFAKGAALGPLFDSVMTCRDNRNFSVVTLRPPANGVGFNPVEMSTCTLRLGAALDDALARVREWVDYTETLGSTAAHWLLFPALGESSDAAYSFKWGVGYASFAAFGRDYDQLTNGSALDRYNELLDGSLRCDSPRLYAARTIRSTSR
jgi:hypothetical protein